MTVNILDNLNNEQCEAVKHIEGPLMVIAGAGSGKTRVITYRIAHMIDSGINPGNILAVTFTNKAAGEMKTRVKSLVNQFVLTCTFHSLAVRILRAHIDRIGYAKTFTIYDDYDQVALIKECIRELKLENEKLKPQTVRYVISKAKNNLQDSAAFRSELRSDKDKQFADIYDLYEKKLILNQALDFDDLISYTVKLFEKSPETLEYYQDKYKYVMIDEYQDINASQYKMVHLLVKKHQNICIVGDEDQSIYKFRGASIENILKFEKSYKNVRVVKLEQNYRSTQSILKAANALVKNNRDRKDKVLWTANGEGEKPTFYSAIDQHKEAQYVVSKILDYKQAGRPLKDIVLFYRIHALSRVLEDELRTNDVPYTLVGDVSFYNRREIKDILAYLRVMASPNDSISMLRIINVPTRGIGQATIDILKDYANAKNISIYEAICERANIESLSKRAEKSIAEFYNLFEQLRSIKVTETMEGLCRKIISNTNYEAYLRKEEYALAQTRIENVEELISAVKEYELTEGRDLEGFLEKVSLISATDKLEDNNDCVTMMSLHNAKGLEFPIAFILGLEEGILPHYNAFNDNSEIEEERRLCYVGITRAMEKLYMTSAASRLLYGNDHNNPRSRFIEEISTSLLIMEEGVKDSYSLFSEDKYNSNFDSYNNPFGATTSTKSRTSTFDNDYLDFDIPAKVAIKPKKKEVKAVTYSVGERVFHSSFGEGKIVGVMGDEIDSMALTIDFMAQPTPKLLMAKLANLKKIK